MRTLAVATALALTLMTAACGEDEPEQAAEPAAEPAATQSASPTESASASAAPAEGDTQVLMGMVGTPDDPDAFEITLTDSSGEQVTELPAGDYTIEVQDLSEIHNFHLMGEGVEETTTVPETGEATWEVTFTEGEYEAVCDPHPNMQLAFTVT